MGGVTAYHVVDCPDHPSSALVLGKGTFCFACGKQVQDDGGPLGIGAYTVPASEELTAEARAAWNESQGIRDFAASMQRERGASPMRAAS
jgi:hypothetical protein